MGDGLLSLEALAWLNENGYSEADHETRIKMIREAREMFDC